MSSTSSTFTLGMFRAESAKFGSMEESRKSIFEGVGCVVVAGDRTSGKVESEDDRERVETVSRVGESGIIASSPLLHLSDRAVRTPIRQTFSFNPMLKSRCLFGKALPPPRLIGEATSPTLALPDPFWR